MPSSPWLTSDVLCNILEQESLRAGPCQLAKARQVCKQWQVRAGADYLWSNLRPRFLDTFIGSSRRLVTRLHRARAAAAARNAQSADCRHISPKSDPAFTASLTLDLPSGLTIFETEQPCITTGQRHMLIHDHNGGDLRTPVHLDTKVLCTVALHRASDCAVIQLFSRVVLKRNALAPGSIAVSAEAMCRLGVASVPVQVYLAMVGATRTLPLPLTPCLHPILNPF